MEDADTTKTGGTKGSVSGLGGGGAAPPSAGQTPAAKTQGEENKYYVDGASVSREAYLKAAPDAGYDPDHLAERNFYPSLTTSKK